MPSVLFIGGTQLTSSDLHLLYARAFAEIGWRATFLSHDSDLPSGERIVQQIGAGFSPLHFALVNRRIRRVARTLRPDLVFITGSNWYVLPETIRRLRRDGARVVLNEQHLQVFRPHQAEALQLYDHVFTQDGGLVRLLRSTSRARAVSLLGPACDPREHRPLALDDDERADLEADVGCVGWGYPNRLALFESLLPFKLRLWGRGWEASAALRPVVRREAVYGLKKTKIYNATAISVNLQSRVYQMEGVTCRPFEVAACGGFCLTEDRPDLHAFFRVDDDIVSFSDAADLERKVAYFLAHDDERRDIAARARARVLREHTYVHRARQVLDAVGLA